MQAWPATFEQGEGIFASTHWSAVLQCAETSSQADAEQCRAALETLCRDYWPPIYSCVRRRGHAHAEAQDLVQGFFVHLLRTRAYAKADQAKGKFRAFLLVSLKNFLTNAHHHAHRLKRGGDQSFVPLDEHLAEAEAAALGNDEGALSADLLFERRWAATVLAHAWETLRSETKANGHSELLDAVQPYLTAGAIAPPPQNEIAQRLGLPVATLRTHIHRLRERFRQALRAEVERTLPLDADVDEELSHLRRTLLGEAGGN